MRLQMPDPVPRPDPIPVEDPPPNDPPVEIPPEGDPVENPVPVRLVKQSRNATGILQTACLNIQRQRRRHILPLPTTCHETSVRPRVRGETARRAPQPQRP